MAKAGILKVDPLGSEPARVVLPNSPLRIHGAGTVPTMPSPELGQHTGEILGEKLGLTEQEIAELKRQRAI